MKIVLPCQYLADIPGKLRVFLHMDMSSPSEKDAILQALVTNKDNIFPTDSVWKRLYKDLVFVVDYSVIEDEEVIKYISIGQNDDREDVSPHDKKHQWRLNHMYASHLNIFIGGGNSEGVDGQDVYNFGLYSGYAQADLDMRDRLVFGKMEGIDSPLDVAKEIAEFLSNIEP
jgi:hypothetical protein